MQEGDILSAAEADYIESMEAFVYMVAMGNTEIETIEALARKLRVQSDILDKET
jgi:pyruvate/2-oxoacid:ferredoxin oxidoreductase alpha subunit